MSYVRANSAQNGMAELGGMGFSQVPAPEESICLAPVEGDQWGANLVLFFGGNEIRLSEFCKAFRHPLLLGTLYISEVDPREWFVELDNIGLVFRGTDELMLMDTLLHLMPAGAA